ncbi:MAG: LysM peptidoglycan-binding protein [Paucimonas sp.]|nr:LysM peptidoglycan-binding protein [Paucimonas sp.]
MKKFSTAVRALPAALIAAQLACLPAQAAGAPDAPAGACAFRADAPDQHRVTKGDTLWDISGRFLDHPWCWPQVWGLNRDQIRDPHWIYPGQVVVFDRKAGKLRLGAAGGSSEAGGALPEVRLSPQARVEAMGNQAIASIPAQAIDPFLTQPLIVDPVAIQQAPHVISADDGHISAGTGDRIFVRGDLKGETNFQAFRAARPLKDPITGAVLGYEAAYLGVVKLDRAARADNEAHRFVVSMGREEIGVGARLLPVPKRQLVNYVPHRPATEIDGRVVSIYDGLSQAGRNNVVVINRGAQHGIDAGTVLSLVRVGRLTRDPLAARDAAPVKIPDASYGSMFVFRVFDKLSYALVMQVTDTVGVNDVVRSPE